MKNNIKYLTSCLRLYHETGNELFFNMFINTVKTSTPILLNDKIEIVEEELHQ